MNPAILPLRSNHLGHLDLDGLGTQTSSEFMNINMFQNKHVKATSDLANVFGRGNIGRPKRRERLVKLLGQEFVHLVEQTMAGCKQRLARPSWRACGRAFLAASTGAWRALALAAGGYSACGASCPQGGVTHRDHGRVHQPVAILEFDTLDDITFASRLRQDDELRGVRSLVLTFMEIGGGKSA